MQHFKVWWNFIQVALKSSSNVDIGTGSIHTLSHLFSSIPACCWVELNIVGKLSLNVWECNSRGDKSIMRGIQEFIGYILFLGKCKEMWVKSTARCNWSEIRMQCRLQGSEKNTRRDMFREILGNFHEKSQEKKLRNMSQKYSRVQWIGMQRRGEESTTRRRDLFREIRKKLHEKSPQKV